MKFQKTLLKQNLTVNGGMFERGPLRKVAMEEWKEVMPPLVNKIEDLINTLKLGGREDCSLRSRSSI